MLKVTKTKMLLKKDARCLKVIFALFKKSSFHFLFHAKKHFFQTYSNSLHRSPCIPKPGVYIISLEVLTQKENWAECLENGSIKSHFCAGFHILEICAEEIT